MPAQRKIAVIGLGYVGLPVAVAFAAHGPAIGFDINRARIEALRRGEDSTGEVDPAELRQPNLLFTDQPGDLRAADFFIIAVPTPVDADKHPDLLPVLRASKTVGQQLRPGGIVVYESTVYPGATEEACVPVLERESGLRCGRDFSVGYSPERINPGDKQHRFSTITKVVSALDAATLDIVAEVYGSVVTAGIYRASSIKVAEASKVIENTQRDVNIALINELAMIFDRLGMDTQEVLEAASTKWNFLRFSPGLVGGHCIGVDPYYLVDKALRVGYVPQVIPAARLLNDEMGQFIAERALEHLSHQGFIIQESTVTILGLSFKENVPDLRNTRIAEIAAYLRDHGLTVQVHDPLVNPQEAWEEYQVRLTPLADLQPAQCVILAVAHRDYTQGGWALLETLLDPRGGVVMDIKGILPRNTVPDKVFLWRL